MNETIKKHCEAVYEKLQSEAKLEDDVLVWRGAISQTVFSLGVPSGYYSRVLNSLEYMGCITRKGRTSFGGESVVWLHRAPGVGVEWQEAPKDDLTELPDYATLAQAVKNLDDLIGGVDIGQALRELEARIANLERRVTKHVDTRGER